MSDSESLFGESGPDASPEREPLSPEIEADSVHREAFIKRLAPSHRAADAWTVHMQPFLSIEPQPFNAQSYEEQHSEAVEGLNTIRWTYAAAEGGQKVTQVSNARIVEWSDGSRTLQVGSEHFEIKSHRQVDPTFVCTSSADDPVLATRQLVWDSMVILPSSMTSTTHVRMARNMATRQQRGQIRVGSVDTREDPDKVQREIERAEQAKEKARRKLAAQRDENSGPSVSSFERRTRETSLDRSEDDMIDDEEEEAEEEEEEEEEAQESGDEAQESAASGGESDDEERANRLNEIKNQPRPKILDDDSD